MPRKGFAMQPVLPFRRLASRRRQRLAAAVAAGLPALHASTDAAPVRR